MKKINLYFFDSETISKSDAIWFYGTMGFIIAILLFIIIPAQIQLWMVR